MLSQHAKRTATMTVRCTPSEKEAMIARATRAGKSVSEFLRGAGLVWVSDAQRNTPQLKTVNETMATARAHTAEALKGFLSSADGKAGA